MADTDSSIGRRFSSGFHSNHVNTLIASSLLLLMSLPHIKLINSSILPIDLNIDENRNFARTMALTWATFAIFYYLIAWKEEPLSLWLNYKKNMGNIINLSEKLIEYIKNDHIKTFNLVGRITSKVNYHSKSIAGDYIRNHYKNCLINIADVTSIPTPIGYDENKWNSAINDVVRLFVDAMNTNKIEDYFFQHEEFDKLVLAIDEAKKDLESYTPKYRELYKSLKLNGFRRIASDIYERAVTFVFYFFVPLLLYFISISHFMGTRIQPLFKPITHYIG